MGGSSSSSVLTSSSSAPASSRSSSWAATPATKRTRLSEGTNGFDSGGLAPLQSGEKLGAALTALQDMDGDRVPELVVAARTDRTVRGLRAQG